MLDEKVIKQIQQDIDNIEQLGADLRGEFNDQVYYKKEIDLEITLGSIEWWVKDIRRKVKKLKKEGK